MLKHSRFASLAAKLRVERYVREAGGYSLEKLFTFLVSRRDKGTVPLSRRLTVFRFSGFAFAGSSGWESGIAAST